MLYCDLASLTCVYTREIPTHVSTRKMATEDLREFIVAVLKSANVVSNLKAQQEDGDLSRGSSYSGLLTRH